MRSTTSFCSMKCMSYDLSAKLGQVERAAASRCCRAGCRPRAADPCRCWRNRTPAHRLHGSSALGRVALAQARDDVAVDLDDVQMIERRSSGSVSAPRPGPISTTQSSRFGATAVTMSAMMRGRPGSSGRSACGRRVAHSATSRIGSAAIHCRCAMAMACSTATNRLPGSAAGAGQFERRAVIDRGADDRQAQRDVDAVAEGWRI
jgi:hypothetical protein